MGWLRANWKRWTELAVKSFEDFCHSVKAERKMAYQMV
jgi:hypothetical protein